ncbi:MAG: response regulator [Candidatus Omnitrophica bacterium]|nr:response regulator [Candidatus Omnitrophota bacterium]
MYRIKKRPKVLVVEDESISREAFSLMLEQKGFISKEAANGKEALEKVMEDKPDVIILDLMMPVMGGLETCLRLKENPETRDIPVIICSATPLTELKKENVRFEGYIGKPFSIRELCKKIEEVLRLD